MSTNLSPAFETLFASEVHQAYQASRALQGVARMREGVVGSSVKFPKLASGTSSIRNPQSDVVPLNVASELIEVSISNYIAAEYSDIFDNQKVSYDERSELSTMLGNAIARRETQVLIDALEAGSPATTVANTVVTSGSAGASDLNVGKILAAKKGLDAKNVPPTDRHLIIHANSLASLLADERAISSDFQTIKALVAGEVNTFLGMQVHVLGDMTEGGIVKDGSNDRFCFAIHKSSLACAVGMAAKTEINYIPEKTSFLVSAMYAAGAGTIDVNGQVSIVCRES